MKNNYPISRNFLPKIFIIILLFLVIIGTSNIFNGNVIFEHQEYKKLANIADSKSILANNFLENKKMDAKFLSNLEEVKDIFGMDLIISEELMQNKIKKIAEKTRDEIDDFLLKNPEMDIQDLQNNSKFKKIAVQRVGDTGYTFVYDYDTMINLFHLKEKFRGINYTLLKYEPLREDWWKITSPTQYGKKELGGFYLWEEPAGEFRKKYKYTSISNLKTHDGIGLAIAATTYVNEYSGSVLLDKNIEDELIDFKKNKKYSDILFIDTKGNVIWTANKENELGTNLISGAYRNSLLSNIFIKSQKNLGMIISDIGLNEKEEPYTFIANPVFDIENEKKLIGFVVLKINSNQIKKLISVDVFSRDVGEIYIINKNYYHLTPLMFDNHSKSMSEETNKKIELIHSSGIDNCFNDFNNYSQNETKKRNRESIYLNYAKKPIKVIGSYSYVLNSGWCIMSEINYNNFKSYIPNENLFLIRSAIIILIFSIITTFIFDYFLKIKERKK